METNTTVEFIQLLYPEVYDAAKKLYTFEVKVYQLIDDTYGKDSLDSIIQLNEFHKEIENVKKQKLKDTQLNRLAQKYSKYFDEYSKATYELKIHIGVKETLTIMESLQKYFKTKV
jgi:adenosine deaminase